MGSIPTNHIWHYGACEDSDIEVYLDYDVAGGFKSPCENKFLWLSESKSIVPHQYAFVKMQANFTDTDSVQHTLANYRTSLVGVRLTGETSKAIAKVVNTIAAEGSDELTLFVKYESSGTDAGHRSERR